MWLVNNYQRLSGETDGVIRYIDPFGFAIILNLLRLRQHTSLGLASAVDKRVYVFGEARGVECVAHALVFCSRLAR